MSGGLVDAQRILAGTRRSTRPARLVVALTVEALTRPVDARSRRNAGDAVAAVAARRTDRPDLSVTGTR
jgi:hypothetical protein